MAEVDGNRNVKLEPLEIPEKLIEGNKFIKWSKTDGVDSIVENPALVTLRIDPKGYIIYWRVTNKDTESLDISCIRDTRIGKHAKIPKPENWERALLECTDPQIPEIAGNTSITLESRCLTIVYGMKFHEPCYLTFIAAEKSPLDIVTLWANFLLKLSHHPLTWHISVEKSFEKVHAKLKYETNQFGKIPVEKCVKILVGNSKRAESALRNVGLVTKGKKNETIDPSDFTLTAFKQVLQSTCRRPEVKEIFKSLGAHRIPDMQSSSTYQKAADKSCLCLSLEQTMRFINNDQRDPRLDEILHPFVTKEQVKAIVKKYEPSITLADKSLLSLEGFEAYLKSGDNLPVSSARYGLFQDMTQPLSHYFINSSHKTYLTGHQYRGRSSVEMYRQCLLIGCRCIDLECWESNSGDEDKPIITHGFTLCTVVLFKDVIEAINESAFKTSRYPVILSIENHVDSPYQQEKMAQYCRDIFGDKLLIDPLNDYPLQPGSPLPSPQDLIGKIIVKNNKMKTNLAVEKSPEKKGVLQHGASIDIGELHFGEKPELQTDVTMSSNSTWPRTEQCQKCFVLTPNAKQLGGVGLKSQQEKQEQNKENGDKSISEKQQGIKKKLKQEGSNSTSPFVQYLNTTESNISLKEDDDDDDNDLDGNFQIVVGGDVGTASRVSKAYGAMSSLVNYLQRTQFKSFEIADKRNHSYETSTFSENGAFCLIEHYPIKIVNYNKRQLSRIYPKGGRVDSTNYNPQLFWNVGCQFVTLNFQTLDLNMQLNLGLFEFNNSCGYLLKPDPMRKKGYRQYDPFACHTIEGVIGASINIKIISGQFLSSLKVSTFVEAYLHGHIADKVQNAYKTATVKSNAINPYYNSNTFSFKKIVLPSLATLRIRVLDTHGNCLGLRHLPVEGLMPGYRYITLRNEGNQPLTMASIFVHIEVQDYIPSELEKQEEKTRKLHTHPPVKTPTQALEKQAFQAQRKPATRPKKPKIELKLEEYKPDSLEVIMKSEKVVHLQQKMDKRVTKFMKKQNEEYDFVYSYYFQEKSRRSSFGALLSRNKTDKIKNMKLPFEFSMALSPEAKKQHMLLLLRQHFEEEKKIRQILNDDFTKNFHGLVQHKQEVEQKQLEKLSEREKNLLWRRKKAEKDENLHELDKSVSKEQLEQMKKEIIDTHIKESVDEMRMLYQLHEQRDEKVKKEQQDILFAIADEEKKRIDQIIHDYNKQLEEIDKIYNTREVGHQQKQGHIATISESSQLSIQRDEVSCGTQTHDDGSSLHSSTN